MPANNHLTYKTDEEVIEALFRTAGNVTKTAKMLGLKQVGELRTRINRNPALAQARQEAFEQMLDRAEEKITKAMSKADARWILERKGRNRGYGNVLTTANLNLNATYDFSKMPLEKRIELLEIIQGVMQTDE